jgi:hypothetical protein
MNTSPKEKPIYCYVPEGQGFKPRQSLHPEAKIFVLPI